MKYIDSIMNVALSLLPAKMDSPQGRAMLIAIGLQESRFEHRRQIGGPAHGFWQFEAGGGVKGVLNHPVTKPLILPILDELKYAPDDCYNAIADNDVLACVFARLLLWTDSKPLPVQADPDGAWFAYVRTWRPGKPHRETWRDLWEQAWH